MIVNDSQLCSWYKVTTRILPLYFKHQITKNQNSNIDLMNWTILLKGLDLGLCNLCLAFLKTFFQIIIKLMYRMNKIDFYCLYFVCLPKLLIISAVEITTYKCFTVYTICSHNMRY